MVSRAPAAAATRTAPMGPIAPARDGVKSVGVSCRVSSCGWHETMRNISARMPSRGSSCRHRTGPREAVALPRPRASRVGLPARTPSLPLAAQDAPQASPVRLRRVLVPASGRLGGVRDRDPVRADPGVLPEPRDAKGWKFGALSGIEEKMQPGP